MSYIDARDGDTAYCTCHHLLSEHDEFGVCGLCECEDPEQEDPISAALP